MIGLLENKDNNSNIQASQVHPEKTERMVLMDKTE